MTFQGQSIATIDKERRIASALAIGMRISNVKFGNRGYNFWHFDANSGCGWNHDVDVPGSPLVFHQMADTHLSGLQRKAFFCDLKSEPLKELMQRLPPDHLKHSFLLPGDNEEAIEVFAECIRRAENPQYAVGCVIVDPNGYWYKNLEGVGAPVSALISFSREFPRIDIVLNLNTRTYRLQKSQGHKVENPRRVFSSLNKAHWLIGRTQYGGNEFLLAVGRNTKTGDHKSIGLHDIDSQEGEFILTMVEGGRQGLML